MCSLARRIINAYKNYVAVDYRKAFSLKTEKKMCG